MVPNASYGPLLKGCRFWAGWHHTGGNIPERSEESWAFSILVQNRTAGGSLTWLESYVRAKALTRSRKSRVLVSPGIKKTSLAKWCNISSYRFGGGLPVTTPACTSALEMSLVPKGSRSECRACSLFGCGPGEAVEREWDPGRGWELGPLGEGARHLPPSREEENAGGLAASVGKVVLSLLIALTPGRMPTPPWPPLLGDGPCVTLRGERCPCLPGSPSPRSALRGHIHLYGEKRCPGPPLVSPAAAAAGHPVTFLRRARVCSRCSPAVTGSSSPGTCLPLGPLSGPASPVPSRGRSPRAPLGSPCGTKGPSVPAGERLRLGGAPSRRGGGTGTPGVIKFLEVYERSFCRTIETLVDIFQEYPDEVEYIFKPSCVPLMRCAGCCGDEGLECVPVDVYNVTMEIMRIKPHQSQHISHMSFLQHSKCDCRPKKDVKNKQEKKSKRGRGKGQKRKRKKGRYKPLSFHCEPCSERRKHLFVQDPQTCKCSCKFTDSRCKSRQLELNERTCRCEKPRR
ncbi:PREDICTED: vascular endothelial growth factor A [Ficedula albicollis]|uniref:vascular endothelial growth factor A n=1 Tax=Ficedula albicollis TaxID=59894 RepID=UPI0007AD94BF|nr:PREDICTED: vascular endothelial growth factor A [Ficedula albicollis]